MPWEPRQCWTSPSPACTERDAVAPAQAGAQFSLMHHRFTKLRYRSSPICAYLLRLLPGRSEYEACEFRVPPQRPASAYDSFPWKQGESEARGQPGWGRCVIEATAPPCQRPHPGLPPQLRVKESLRDGLRSWRVEAALMKPELKLAHMGLRRYGRVLDVSPETSNSAPPQKNK